MSALGEKVRRFIGRCVLTAIEDGTGIQSVQIEGLADERHDGVEHFQPYGFSAVPFPDAEGIVVYVGGARAHGVVIVADDRRHRPRGLQPGEAGLYDDQDQIVRLFRDRIEINSPFEVKVVAPQVTVESDSVDLGGAGGPAVARVGDTVSGGVITSGSSKVRAS